MGHQRALSVFLSLDFYFMLLFFSYYVLTLCDPMVCSMSGFPVLPYLLKLAQTHVPRIGDVI